MLHISYQTGDSKSSRKKLEHCLLQNNTWIPFLVPKGFYFYKLGDSTPVTCTIPWLVSFSDELDLFWKVSICNSDCMHTM